ncbi:LysM peptidoglycan-binding domain-containing protein [Kitasatospora purpeofusca]|uniref:LysM peptidoglycan-binding domain-containing protein n=1 Tax=Kitasatospora purpeofusca TaxID=67352 RepID=UPI0022504D0D|nr:LysM peptidoglycan-binding domain-containing protein [Kitasatospora purpeofusca]MCX4687302.1 LysM peptidoglycan-binding domain-containing protein [Kitasatospora purpeofusca]
MGTAADMVARASRDVGYKEGPNNDTVYGRWYGLNYNPYCDMAVSMWASEIGESGAVGRFAYCPSHVNDFKAKGRWFGRNADAQPGDIVFFSWDGGPVADHVGVVRAPASAGQDVPTVEANTSSGTAGSQGNGDGVYFRTRPRSSILGFGRPAYSGGSAGGSGRKYVVKAGQTLGGIAALLGVSLASLMGSNPQVANPNMIHPGDSLNVPANAPANPGTSGGGSAPAPAPAPAPKPTPAPSPKPPAYAPPAFPNGIAPDHTRPSARQLQAALKAAGYMPKSVAVADNYGPQTQRAVGKFLDAHPQFKERGKTYDPSIGPKGWAYLFRMAYGR